MMQIASILGLVVIIGICMGVYYLKVYNPHT